MPSRQRSAGPSLVEIARYWDGRHGVYLHYDIGEPCCWACGFAADTSHDGEVDAYNHCSSWLDRAHLVAHASGGAFTVDNCALLCHRCHREMDRDLDLNTIPERAVEWIKGYTQRRGEAVLAALRSMGVDPEQFDEAAYRRLEPKLATEGVLSPFHLATLIREAVTTEPEALSS